MREPGRKASQTGSAPERARGKVAHAPLGIGGSLVPGRLDRGFGTAPLSPVPGAEDIGVQRAGVLTRRGRAAAQWTCASRRRKEQTDLVFGYHLLLGLGRECAVVCQLQPLPLRGPAVSQKTPGSRRESERKSSGPDELGGVAHRKAPRPGAAVPPPASFGHRAAPSLLLAPANASCHWIERICLAAVARDALAVHPSASQSRCHVSQPLWTMSACCIRTPP